METKELKGIKRALFNTAWKTIICKKADSKMKCEIRQQETSNL